MEITFTIEKLVVQPVYPVSRNRFLNVSDLHLLIFFIAHLFTHKSL